MRYHDAVPVRAKVKAERIQRGARIMLAIQDTPGAAIRRSDVALLSTIKHSAAGVADVLAKAGMLADDREPAIVCWFTVAVRDLPEQMRHELGTWFDIMRHGSATPPLRLPRADSTTDTQLRYVLPVSGQARPCAGRPGRACGGRWTPRTRPRRC